MICYNLKTGRFEAMINGVIVASEESYLAANDAMLVVKQAIIKAVGFLTDIITPPTPPAAPAAAKPKRSKKPKVCGPQCVACHQPTTPIADGVYYCSLGKEWNVYINNAIAHAFPKKEFREAHDYLNHSRTDALRRAA